MDNTNNFINKNKINDKIKNDEIKDNNKIKNNNSNNFNNSNNNFNGLNNHNYNNKDKNFLKMIEILKKELSKDSTVNAISKEKDEKFRAFKVLISTILSARTKDETTEMVSKRLYKVVKNVDDLINIETEELEKLIYPVGFYRAKAKNLKKLGIMLKNKYNGEVPNNIEELLKLPGVGRKTANLVITLAFDDYGICVDTHVHRICNRWEYVDTENPEDTEGILREKLPKKYWKEINNLLVIFGREVCSPTPKCERCIDKIKSICPYYKKLKYFKEILNKYNFKQVSKNNIPDKTGTYILRIRLKTGKKIKVGKKELFFKRGFYYYVGSAMGKTNNLKRRIERHLRDDKKLHWHIDYLLKHGKIDKIYITEKSVECEVAQDLINYMNYIPKFGCSDCNCESHLIFMKF